MDARMTPEEVADSAISSGKVAVLHRIFSHRETEPAVDPSPRLRARVAQAVWLGLIGGWLELGVTLGHRAAIGTVTRISYRQNWYHVPMGMMAHLAILAAWLGLVGASWRFRHRLRRLDRALAAFGLFLTFLSPLLAIEEIYWPCSVILAAGLSARLAPWWLRRRGPLLRRTLPALAAASIVLVVASFAWQRSAESRALAALPAAPPGAPNVVLLVLDTVRADHLSLYGYARETTPHLEALGSRSILFDFARAPAPWTLPSHATMFTGRWPHELSADIDRPLDATHPTLAAFLADHGYLTGGFTGNTFYTNAWFGLDRGFSHYEDLRENRTISVQETLRCAALGRFLMPVAVDLGLWPTTAKFPPRKRADGIRQDAMSWLDGQEAGRPFFLFLNFFDAHDPYLVPDGFPVRFSSPDRAAMRKANVRYIKPPTGTEKPEGPVAPPADLTRTMLDGYDDCLRYVDDQIARLLAELDRRGRGRDTWVIITADHGEQFGEHGAYRHGGTLYRGEVDIPLLIVPPAGVSPRRISAPVSPRDLPATVADLAGLSSSSPFPGGSLRRHWDANSAAPPPGDSPLSELKLPADHVPSSDGAKPDRFQAALVDRDAIYHRSPIKPEELYDASDRSEAKDLAPHPDSAETLHRVRSLLDRARREEP